MVIVLTAKHFAHGKKMQKCKNKKIENQGIRFALVYSQFMKNSNYRIKIFCFLFLFLFLFLLFCLSFHTTHHLYSRRQKEWPCYYQNTQTQLFDGVSADVLLYSKYCDP